MVRVGYNTVKNLVGSKQSFCFGMKGLKLRLPEQRLNHSAMARGKFKGMSNTFLTLPSWSRRRLSLDGGRA